MKKLFSSIIIVMMIALAFTAVASAAENYTPDADGLYEIEHAVTAEDGTQFGMVVIEATGDEAFALDEATIRYIDQVGAADGKIAFDAFAPMDLKNEGTYKVYIGGGDLDEATFIGTLGEAVAAPELTSITVTPATSTIKVGETVTLTATANDNLTPEYTWVSSDDEVATVANGVVTAKKAGEVTITVSSGTVSATAKVTVEEETASEVLYGDVDGNGEVKNKDVLTLARFLAEWPTYPESIINKANADCKLDGQIKNSDLLALARYLAEWPTHPSLPIQ